MPSLKQLESLYSEKEYFEKLARPTGRSLLDAILSIRFFPEYDEYVEKHTSKGSLLDIGCGNGEFAERMLKKGWNVQCVEKSIVAAKRAEKRIGRGKIKVGEVTEVEIKSSFDIITAWHVLEHVPNPFEFMK
ncbi:MAG: methyltransferase type 12, partial [uncultured bacterium]